MRNCMFDLSLSQTYVRNQCSPQHTQGMSAQQAFSLDLSLMWEWEECNSYDVASGSA